MDHKDSTDIEDNDVKIKRRTLIDSRTLSGKFNFRLEGISLKIHSHKSSHNEKQFNWVKRDGIFDTSENDVSYLISKFLVQKKISKIDLIEKMEMFAVVYEKLFKEGGWDLYNLDLLIIPQPQPSKEENEKDKLKSVKKVTKKQKTEFSIKINGIKNYSLVKDTNSENFYKGLQSLITFLKDNIII